MLATLMDLDLNEKLQCSYDLLLLKEQCCKGI